MKVQPDQLAGALNKGLASCYVVFGDEQLLVLEGADAIRAQAQGEGFVEREVLEGGPKFDYSELTAAGQVMSLFGGKRLIDFRLPTGKPGKVGSEAIVALANQKNPDTLLLVTCGKLDKPSQSAKWFKSLDSAGVSVQCWPVRASELPRFLEQRMRAAGLSPEPGAVHALAARVEGNLLAAQQEIDKLAILHGNATITEADIMAQVADSARFQVFAVLDEMLAGATGRAIRMLRNMADEGVAAPLIAMLITREVRTLARLKAASDRGANLQAEYRNLRIWDSRKRLFEQTLRRHRADYWRDCLADCATLDRAAKGLAPEDPWELLETIISKVARPSPHRTAL